MSQHCGRYQRFTSRRDFLKKAGAGFGMMGLAGLLQGDGLLAADFAPEGTLDPMTPRLPHYPAKAKAIIWLFMEGAPSSVDLFDPKPELTKRDGQRISIDVFNGNPGPLMKSPLAWMTGAGIKGGVSYGETDEIGYKAVTDRTSVHDLHATMLHLLGMDHEKLTYFHNGRSYRLTDVAADVIERVLV